ncbi:MAG: hypothetical protein ACREIA_20090 [Opitutaceae bacterium]
MNTRLCTFAAGRILLHLACMVRHGNLRWHWAGIAREVVHGSHLPRHG